MAETYDPLDFEFEDSIPTSPVAKKKKKLIDLDDLLEDYQKEQKKINEKKSKRTKIRKVSEGEDEFDDATEARLAECVDKCEKEAQTFTICINQVGGDDAMPVWCIQVFGDQKIFPQQEYPDEKSCVLLQSFINHELNSLVELNIEEGEKFLEGLLADGWLLNLVYTCGSVERSIATWIFNLMLYSSNKTLVTAACDFWCTILNTKDKADLSNIKIDWLPRYLDFRRALENYGFLLSSPPTSSSDVDMVHSEVEELLCIIVSFFLDRQLLGLSVILYECMLSTLNFFRYEEWHDSCDKIATSLANRSPRDINCLRVVESIVGVDTRSKQLRSSVAFQFLVVILDEKVSDAEETLRLLISINVKEKNCDLFKIYICLNLAENWLFLDLSLKENKSVQRLWGIFLQNCACGITINDSRSYASNVRKMHLFLPSTTLTFVTLVFKMTYKNQIKCTGSLYSIISSSRNSHVIILQVHALECSKS
ncbi:hypothetical protein F511_05252 [Dorcoceras hygrometricum]|uniref:Coiled-coil SMC6 And NSE5 INteracting (CANIN) domain-containing protein n=1 Tax=Dorcoceras hygrometricum TaxID=472368 RepID=A0A2Z7CJB0_9LAMI|nr:hypothetical protein F511_05252 [Dorcoceras hygrometricum]